MTRFFGLKSIKFGRRISRKRKRRSNAGDHGRGCGACRNWNNSAPLLTCNRDFGRLWPLSIACLS